MSLHNKWLLGGLSIILLMSFNLGFAVGDTELQSVGQTRAAWMLQHSTLESIALTGLSLDQSEFNPADDSAGSYKMNREEEEFSGSSANAGLTMLASMVLPGSGEAIMGYKRGYAMMAVDIFAWTQVKKYHDDGEDLRQAYYDFADAHYTDEWLVEAYNPASSDIERSGEGAIYFPSIDPVTDVTELGNLPLYVTKEDDLREYYENLGKWDQFIFGWDDYTRASVAHPEFDYVPTETTSDLHQPWVSENRETYRGMRLESNDAFKTRDRWLYVNIGMRVFSVMQVAYLQGLLGGGPANSLEVAGHSVEIIAQPYGFTRGVMAAKVAF